MGIHMVAAQKPFHQREGVIWFDGQFVNWKDAKIHVLTHGLHYGSSIFEGERVYNGKIFKSLEHSKRFLASAQIMNMELPFSIEEIEEAKLDLIKQNNIDYGYMRILAWRGSEEMKIGGEKCKIHILIAVWKVDKELNKYAQTKGLKVCISKWKRPPAESFPHQAKVGGGYVISSLAKQEATDKGFNDALMLDYRGYIAEGSGANFFAIKDGKLFTPVADCFLNGITRQTILELAEKNNIPVSETRITPDQLEEFEEVFFVGTAAGISPIIQIEDYTYNIGAMTKRLIELYNKVTEVD